MALILVFVLVETIPFYYVLDIQFMEIFFQKTFSSSVMEPLVEPASMSIMSLNSYILGGGGRQTFDRGGF